MRLYSNKIGIMVSMFGLITMIAALFTVLPPDCFALQNEPVDFRGIKWKTHVSEISSMKLLARDGDLQFYEKSDENLKIGEAPLDRIVYGFYKDEFYNVFLYYSSLPTFSRIKEVFTQNYGEPYQPNQYVDKYFWYGKHVDILLTFDELAKNGRISYFYKPVVEAMEADEQTKAQRGAADL
jgi:hypothetical protein